VHYEHRSPVAPFEAILNCRAEVAKQGNCPSHLLPALVLRRAFAVCTLPTGWNEPRGRIAASSSSCARRGTGVSAESKPQAPLEALKLRAAEHPFER
ncbi:MAG: hypothetical protein QXP01_00755, partial [Candidatus Hadarchaeum sp.]